MNHRQNLKKTPQFNKTDTYTDIDSKELDALMQRVQEAKGHDLVSGSPF
ncbi:hypothetical protein [uncultured Vibrio sp.]|nr:hypothetical protein [uncultured Vibrio sp.]